MRAVLFISILVLVLMLWLPASISHDEDEKDAKYHFKKLTQKIDDIKLSLIASNSSIPSHKVVKRSAYDRKVSRADDLILSSFASYCSNFNSDPGISKYLENKAKRQPLSTRDVKGYTRYTTHDTLPSGAWDFEAFPVKVLTQEEDNKLWIIFHIAHSETARVSRLDFYDFQEVVLEFPESACHEIVSKARFSIPLPKTCEDLRNERKLEIFRIGTGIGLKGMNVHIDPCYMQEEGKRPIRTSVWKKPFFRLKTSSTSVEADKTVLIGNNPNNNGTTFEVEAFLLTSTELEIRLVLWDWERQKTIQSIAILAESIHGWSEIEYKGDEDEDESQHLFKMTKINGPCGLDNKGEEVIQPRRQCVRLRIDVRPMPGQNVSGQMNLFEHSWHELSASLDAAMEVTVPLVQPDSPLQTLPENFIYITPKSRFRCNRRGNVDHRLSGFGQNCVIQCQAYGQDISFVYINKLTPTKGRERIQSGSYVLPNTAAAILDLGRWNVVEGDFRCTVVSKRGKTTSRKIKLYNRLFTRITTLEVDSKDTDTATVTCNVYGDQSLEVSLSVSKDNGENKTQLVVDDKSDYNTTFSESETSKNMTVTIPWKDLKYPLERLSCEAKGDRGKDRNDILLRRFYQNKFGIFPMVNKSEMKVEMLTYNSLLATCNVTGERPLDVRMFLRRYGDSDVVLMQEKLTSGAGSDEVEVSHVLSRQDPGYSWGELYSSHLMCEAENKYGVENRELRDVFYHLLP